MVSSWSKDGRSPGGGGRRRRRAVVVGRPRSRSRALGTTRRESRPRRPGCGLRRGRGTNGNRALEQQGYSVLPRLGLSLYSCLVDLGRDHIYLGASVTLCAGAVRDVSALLADEVLEKVGHTRWVFVIPKMLRPYFLHHRELLGKLARSAWETVLELMCAAAGDAGMRPGMVAVVQTAGDLGMGARWVPRSPLHYCVALCWPRFRGRVRSQGW
jgi:hypothetical protein